MKKLKELREKKQRLEDQARTLLASVTADTPAADAKRIEGEHATLLQQIAAVAEEIRAAEAEEGDGKKGGKRARKARAKKNDDDDSDEDDDDSDEDDDDDSDEDDDDEKKKGSRKKRGARAGAEDGDDDDEQRAAGRLSRAKLAEMVMIDSQARGLGIDLNLANAMKTAEGPDGMRKRLFEQLATRSQQSGPIGSAHAGAIEFGRDETDGRALSMEIALVTRMLASRRDNKLEYKPKRPEEAALIERHRDQARQYMDMGFVEIAATCIGHRGHIWSARDKEQILTRAFQSTSDFPAIFENVLNKSLLARYELAAPTYREIAVERPFNDFRPHPQIRAGEFPQPQPLTETGELRYGTTTDSKETVSVVPYGRIFPISRTMLVNDELGAIDQILGSAGDAVLIFENVTFFAMFNSNPALVQDNTAVFAAGHANLAAGGDIGAPSVTTIGTGRKSLRQMKSLTGNLINVPPRIILTGAVQETAADQMVATITPTLTTSVNPFSGRLRSVSDANITDSSWYLLTEPGRVPCFVYGFLSGYSGPRVRTFEPFGMQGVKISLEHDFGCGAIDYRGAYKNPGA